MTEPVILRWNATVHYRTDDGPLNVEHTLLELRDLHDLVERGPHWDTIERIEITRVVPDYGDATLTVERSEQL
jgi:hypothetical protein